MEQYIFYLLLLDALFANITAWTASSWYTKTMGGFARFLPMAKGWPLVYLALVLWAGSLLYRMGALTLIS